MSELVHEYTTKLKSFQLLSFVIFIFTITYVINGIIPGEEQSLSQPISYGILGLFAAGFLFYFGQKKRSILIYNDRIEYRKTKSEFIANWSDIVLVKSFSEMGKKTESLILMTSDDELLTISSAFFDREKLISAFNKIVELNTGREDLTVEDDRNWLSESIN